MAVQDEVDGISYEEFRGRPKLEQILPYRAGYETRDREAIQKALTKGSLAGVVSTSALELGLDIGDLDIVVLLNTPPTVKSFRQRIGESGTQTRCCLHPCRQPGCDGSLASVRWPKP